MGQEPISVILLEPLIDSMSALVHVLEKSKQVEFINVPTAEEALQVAQQFLPCVIMVSIRGSLDGASQVELLKKLEKPIRSGQLKALVISSVKNHPLARNIAAIGITDYAEEPIPTKSLLFKINLIFKAIIAQRKRNDSSKNNEKVVFKAGDNKKSDESVSISSNVPAKYKPALQFGEDTFVFKGTLPRKIGQKFILEAEGPLPETGDWVPEPGKESKVRKWKWIPKINQDEEKQGMGDGWVHEGEKPIFEEGKGRWQLKSQKPRLDFYRDGRVVGSKVETDESGNVVIAEDSQIAKENLMLNKTLVAQAREKMVKKAVSLQEKERQAEEEKKIGAKKIAVDAKNKSDLNENENDRIGAFSSKLSERKKEAQRKMGISNEGVKEEQGKLVAESDFRKRAETKINEQHASDGESDAAELFEKRKIKKTTGSGAEGFKLRTKEQSLKRLEKDGIVEEERIREKTSTDPEWSLGEERLSEDSIKEQLKNDQNSFQRKDGSRARSLAGRTGDSKEWNEASKVVAVKEEQRQQSNLISEESEIERSRGAAALMKAQSRAQKRIAELKKQILEEASRPLKDELTEEEERSLRHELSVKDRPELNARDLSRMARLEKAKAHKKEIHDIKESLEGRGVPLDALFPPDPESDWDQQDSDDKKKKRNFRAIDSIDENAEDLFGLGRKKKEKKSGKERRLGEADIYFLMQNEVQPEDGSWECEDGQWIYLPNTVFESGYDRLEDLLPAWIFEGEDEPELLKETKKWKFIASAPRKVEVFDDLPHAVKDLLKNLLDQACMALGKPEPAGAPPKINEEFKKKKFDEQKENGTASIEAERFAENDLQEHSENLQVQKTRDRNEEENGHDFGPEKDIDSLEQNENLTDGPPLEFRKKRPLNSDNSRAQEDGDLIVEAVDRPRQKLSKGLEKKDSESVLAEDASAKKENHGKMILEEERDIGLGDLPQEELLMENGLEKVALGDSVEEDLGKVSGENNPANKNRKRSVADLSDLNEGGQESESQEGYGAHGLGGVDAKEEESLKSGAGFVPGQRDSYSENQENKIERKNGAEPPDEEVLFESAATAGFKQEFSLSARELLILVAINDIKRLRYSAHERVPLFLRAIGAVLPGFRCKFSIRSDREIVAESGGTDSLADNQISIRVESRVDSLEIGTLFVVLPEGRNKLSRREEFVFNQFAAAIALLLDENDGKSAQRENKTA